MHVVHVIRDLDQSSGGPSRSIPALARHQAALLGADNITVAFQDRGAAMTIDPVKSEFSTLVSSATKIASELGHLHRRQPIDIMHCHGLWSPTIHFAARAARRLKIPYLISPRGMLSQWCFASKGLRKQVAWRGYQRRDLERANAIHVTSELEAADVLGLVQSDRVRVIPNGVEPAPESVPPREQPMFPNRRLVVSLARLHPVKALDRLLRAWKASAAEDWHLLIAGPGDAEYRQQLQGLADSCPLNNASIEGPIDGIRKWQVFDEAELFVLPSESENFGMSLAEALSAAVPVITTQGTPWEDVHAHECGWWIPGDESSLLDSLQTAMSTDPLQLKAMGRRGVELMKSKYCWRQIAEHTIAVYNELKTEHVNA